MLCCDKKGRRREHIMTIRISDYYQKLLTQQIRNMDDGRKLRLLYTISQAIDRIEDEGTVLQVERLINKVVKSE